MASKDYLFVNKDSRSPSLSRNTGTEASLASRVNKHVQQQRFWRSSGPRRSWYRPFVRSDSSSSAPSPTQSDTPILEDSADTSRRTSYDQHSPRLPRGSTSARVSPIISKQTSKSPTQEQPDFNNDVKLMRGRWVVPPELVSFIKDPGAAVDAFTTIAMPLTPILVEVLQRHITWALTACITDFTVQEGVKHIFATILQDRMRAAAFLAMATAQQKKTGGLTFPTDQSPELYSYRATKMIREHIANHQGLLPSYTLVDIFRLALCEWINENYYAAGIHFSYVSRLWDDFEPRDPVDYHVLEVCSSEDVFFAIDIDEKPLLALNWLPRLSTSPRTLSAGSRTLSNRKDERPKAESEVSSLENAVVSWQLEASLRRAKSPLIEILHSCVVALKTIPKFRHVDFGAVLIGPLWIMKRRIHATLHQLQSLDTPAPSADDSIRRALIIVLLLTSTTSERRLGRTNLGRLAERLRTSLESNEELLNSEGTRQMSDVQKEQLQDPGLWMWMYVVGMAAARQLPSRSCTRHWFTKRALMLAIRLCGFSASSHDLEKLLSSYLYFDNALGETVENLSAAVASYSRRQANGAMPEYTCS